MHDDDSPPRRPCGTKTAGSLVSSCAGGVISTIRLPDLTFSHLFPVHVCPIRPLLLTWLVLSCLFRALRGHLIFFELAEEQIRTKTWRKEHLACYRSLYCPGRDYEPRDDTHHREDLERDQ